MTIDRILVVCSERKIMQSLSLLWSMRNVIEQAGKKHFIVHLIDLAKKDFEDVDLVITVGGDGTFIRTSHHVDNIPILGINLVPDKSEGFHTSLNPENLYLLKKILNGDYKIEEIQRIKVILNDQILKEHALNEVYVGTEKQFHTSRYKIKHGDLEEEHRSSGTLIATKSGSTAWYKSAGGKTFLEKEKLKFLIREPYQGRLFQIKLLEGEINKGEKVKFESTRDDGGIISIDSSKNYNFNKGDIVEVELSDKPLNKIKI